MVPTPAREKDGAAAADAAIVTAICAGDSATEEEFCARFRPRVRLKVGATLRGRPDCEDLTNEILQAALLSLRGGRFRGECQLSTFVHAIAKNKVAEYLRRRRPETTELTEDIPSTTAFPDENLAQKEAAEAIARAVGQLKPKYREVLYLYYYKGLAISEIAARMSAPPRRVSEWKDYGLKVLRSKYGKALDAFR